MLLNYLITTDDDTSCSFLQVELMTGRSMAKDCGALWLNDVLLPRRNPCFEMLEYAGGISCTIHFCPRAHTRLLLGR